MEDAALSILQVWKDSPPIAYRNMKGTVVCFPIGLVVQALYEHSTIDAQIGEAALAVQIENLDSVVDVARSRRIEGSDDG